MDFGIIYVVLLGVSVLAGFMYQWTFGWRSFLGATLSFTLIAPLVFCVLSFVLGIIYFLFEQEKNFAGFAAFFGPAILFTIYIWIRILANKRIEKNENRKVTTLRNEANQWLHRFPFLNEEQREVKVYISNNQAVGRVHVWYNTEEERKIVEENKVGLHRNLYLECYPKNRENSDHL